MLQCPVVKLQTPVAHAWRNLGQAWERELMGYNMMQ